MSDEPAWVGLDLGTQSARALVASGSGEVLAAASEPLESRRAGARHEQDPEQWWAALSAAARSALAGIGPARVGGVACCATSGTILLVDASGSPLTPGLMYDDTRATEEVRRVNDVGAETWAELGYNRMQASWALPRLVWLLRELGGRAGAGTRLAHQPDVITSRLVGEAVPSDTSHALKTGYHLIEDRWPSEVMAALAVPQELLPDVVLSGTRLGTVSAGAAEETGIPAGTPVVAGMTDGCAAQLGAGALGAGDWNSVLGTTLVLKGATQALVRDPLGVVYSHRSPDGGWLPGGASSVGAGTLSAHYPGRDLEALDALAARREPAGAVVYPLVAQGERFPFAAPEAHELTLGEPADEADHYAALLQGVAFAERLAFDYLDLLGAPTDGQLSLTGGGARSRYWCQLRADVLDRPVRLPVNAEAALGMAVLAAAADGRRVREVAAEMVRVREVIEPRPGHGARLGASYIRLVDELERREWLDPAVAAHARGKASSG